MSDDHTKIILGLLDATVALTELPHAGQVALPFRACSVVLDARLPA